MRRDASAGQKRYRIDSLDAALTVLESFVDAPSATQGVTEMSRRLGMSKNRVFRILTTLSARGYIQQDEETQAYRLGFWLMRLGQEVRRRLDIHALASPVLAHLARETGEVAHLIVRRDDRAVCVQHRGGGRMFQMYDKIGEPIPLHIGASPKLLLAYAPEDERERLLESMPLTRFTPNTITTLPALRQRLAEIRAQGYSVDDEGFEIGVCAVGAPIFDGQGGVAGGITITVPATRFSADARGTLIAAVIDGAAEVSAALGYAARPDSRPRKTRRAAGRSPSDGQVVETERRRRRAEEGRERKIRRSRV
jgi:DNA-binding IclR family transcriptional regulator